VEPGSRSSPDRLTLAVCCFVTAVCALVAAVGADSAWLAALGGVVTGSWSIPAGVPFAAVSSAGWHNVPVLGEILFHAFHAGLGTRGLVLAQLTAVAICLSLVSLDMRRAGAADAPAALVLLLSAIGAAPALLIARSQLFSLALFPLLVLLLRSEARIPSRRVWLLVPLVALWSNLHGGVLLGVAVAGVYLLLARARREPLEAAGVAGGMVAALFATPALLGTAAYYRGVMSSEAAVHGEGMWQPLSPGALFDVLFVVIAIPLVVLAWRSRPAMWELVALAGLAAAAVHAGRNEVWFVLFVAPLAAKGLSGSRAWRSLVPRWAGSALAVGFAAVAAVGLARAPSAPGASAALLSQAVRAADGTPILADAKNAEQLAVSGDRILIGNPLDAFPKREQRVYLDWLAGRPAGDAEASRVRAVVVTLGSAADRRLARRSDFRRVGRDGQAALYVRDRSRPGRCTAAASTTGWRPCGS
jgi:hypothetical protein